MNSHKLKFKPAPNFTKKLWKNKPIKWGLFHLYRKPQYTRISDSSFCLLDNKWERKIKKLCPVQYFFRETIPIKAKVFQYKIWDMKFNIKYYFKPYNVLKVNTLPKTCCDEDTLLVHSMFAVMNRYLSQLPENTVDFESDEEHEKFWKEINEIKDWWDKREERKNKEEQALDEWSKDRKSKKKLKYIADLELKHYKEEEEMLIKLVKLRKFLWI